MNWKRYLLPAVIGCLMLARASTWGQATASASRGGTVVDKTGAVIPKADVSLTNKETGATRAATTDGAGEYRFDPLSAGIYKVRVAATRNLQLIFQSFTSSIMPTTAITSTPWLMMRARLPDQSGSLIPRAVRCRGRSPASSGPGSPSKRTIT